MRRSLLALGLMGFMSMAMAADGTTGATASADGKTGATAAAAAGAAAMTANLCLPQEFGGVADGKSLNTAAIQQAIDKCAALGGGEVRLSEGLWLSGPLELKSNIMLNIMADATLKAGITHENLTLPAI